MNFVKLMSAFDANGNGIVEQKEFVDLCENATGGPAPSLAKPSKKATTASPFNK
jgi:hypothetical protein